MRGKTIFTGRELYLCVGRASFFKADEGHTGKLEVVEALHKKISGRLGLTYASHPYLSSLPDGEETDWLAVMMREASISTMFLLAGLSQAVSVAER
jgi:hypothetical protein